MTRHCAVWLQGVVFPFFFFGVTMLEAAVDTAGLHLHLFTKLCKFYIHICLVSGRRLWVVSAVMNFLVP